MIQVLRKQQDKETIMEEDTTTYERNTQKDDTITEMLLDMRKERQKDEKE